jgi:Fe-S cluster assembly scaffold protein SufB
MKHIGKKTTSTILSKGSLQKDSHKVFRGNLVFEKGSTGSVGKEEEFVMLLNEKLKSDSIPGLFCKEDDVIGEHAASVGQVDKNKLFYLMSRGFSEPEARKLMIRSAYEEVLVKMKIGEVSEVVSQEINERIS